MAKVVRILILLFVLLQGCQAYNGYKLFKLTPRTHRHVQAIRNIVEELDGRSMEGEVSVWNDHVLLNKPVNVHASPTKLNALHDYITEHGLEGEVVIEDVGQKIIEQATSRDRSFEGNVLSNFTFDEYHPLDEIEEWMLSIQEAHKDVSEIVTIGYSYLQHPIYALRVSLDLKATVPKPVIWLDAGIHAREWVAPATMVFFINKFLEDYQTDEILKKSLETHDWYFMPVFNVDGYNFSWYQDENGTFPNRLWRRTRTPNVGYGDECSGADPNRNWDRMWGTTDGISFDPCNNQYCGTSPWSEPAVRQVAFFLRDKIQLDVYFAYHSFSQYFMLPYGYTSDTADHFSELMEICKRGSARVKEVHGTDYECNSLIELVGPNSGSSVDYVYDVIGTKFTFGVELRDDGTHGFLLPKEQIIPNCEENWPFVLQVIEDFMKSNSQKLNSSFIHLFVFSVLSTYITISKVV